MLPGQVPRVVQAPQFGALVARVPLAEGVAQRDDPLLGAGLLLVAAPAVDRVEAARGDGVQQRLGLQGIARPVGALDEAPVVDPVLHPLDGQPQPVAGHDVVAEGEDLGEVVPGVDVEQAERQRGRPEGLAGDVQHDDRVLAAGEQQDGPLGLGGDLPDDVDRLVLERVEVVVAGRSRRGRRPGGARGGAHRWIPHSVLVRPAQRPDLGSCPGATLRVQVAHPMDG